ncbi:MAG: GNAT family N-acetyltransferase [Acidobacteriales bacterium]|nr:GNAT family N-acetyltransferase [Terriglobales bacterium]
MPLRLRESLPGDFERLLEIDRECFPPGIAYSRLELKFYMKRPGAFTLIAELPEICGFIVAELNRGRQGHVITIDVLAAARRLGVGTALLTASEDRLRTAGATRLHLETAVDNLPAIRFYKRHGYFLERTIPHYYANGVDAFVMSKDL